MSDDETVFEQTRRALADPEYRRAYADAQLDTRLAIQIRVLRKQRGWSQAELGRRSGMTQSRISALEDCNYSGWSARTLKRLAEAFDLPLEIQFSDWGIVGLAPGRAALERLSYDEAVSAEREPHGNVATNALHRCEHGLYLVQTTCQQCAKLQPASSTVTGPVGGALSVPNSGDSGQPSMKSHE